MKKCNRLLALLGLLTFAGCGGSGDSSGTSNGRAALDVYVTENNTMNVAASFRSNYKQVLVTLYKIELTPDGTNYTTVFTTTTGQALDLASLSNTAALLATVNVPTGTYTNARITFGDHFTLVSDTGVSTSTAVDSSIGTVSNGQVSIVVTTPTRVQSGKLSALYVDFDLAIFQLTGGLLRPSVRCGDGTDIVGRLQIVYLVGTVANFIAGTGFDLVGLDGRTISVSLDGRTTVTSGQTGISIRLANGQSVLVEGINNPLVEGTGNPSTHPILATSITLNDYTTVPRKRAGGTVASLDTTAKSFVLTIEHTEGIQTTGGTITVLTDANTVFPKGGLYAGSATTGSFANLVAGHDVQVEGSFDITTQTLTAKAIFTH